MCLRRNTRNETFVFKNKIMKNCEKDKITAVIIDNKLIFKCHVKNLCKRDLEKVYALARLSRYLNNVQESLIFKSVNRSQFSHFPIVWMFCSSQTNNMIKNLHERVHRIVSIIKFQFRNPAESSDIYYYHRNSQTLITEA